MIIEGDEVYDMLRVIEDEPSISMKVGLLEDLLAYDLFADVVRLAYNPYTRFYMTSNSLLGITGQGALNFGEQHVKLLQSFASRDVTGNEAIEAAAEAISKMTPSSAWLFKDILDKDLKCDIGVKLINRAEKNFLPETVYMRCCLPKDIRNFNWKGAYVQEKADGMYGTITVSNEGIVCQNRSGMLFPENAFSEIKREVKEVPIESLALGGLKFPEYYQIQGEFLVTFDGQVMPRKTGNGILNSVLKSDSEMPEGIGFLFIAWDFIDYKTLSTKEEKTPYEVRFARVLRYKDFVHRIKPIPYAVINSEQEAMDFFKEMIVQNKEGAIVKEAKAIWKSHTSKQQFKLKSEKDCDLEVIMLNPGTGKNKKTFGSILCRSKEGNLEVSVSGLTDSMREFIWADRKDIAGKIVSVRFNEVINSKDKPGMFSLFLPRFIEIRLDKHEADTLKHIKEL